MEHCDPRFCALLSNDLEQWNDPDMVVYGLWPDLTLAGYNAAWVRFADANGGRAVLDRFGLGCYVPEGDQPSAATVLSERVPATVSTSIMVGSTVLRTPA